MPAKSPSPRCRSEFPRGDEAYLHHTEVEVGVIAIGQFAYGIFTLSQFGLGVFSVSKFTVAGYALTQFGFAYSLIAQFGVYIHEGRGQLVMSLSELLGML